MVSPFPRLCGLVRGPQRRLAGRSAGRPVSGDRRQLFFPASDD